MKFILENLFILIVMAMAASALTFNQVAASRMQPAVPARMQTHLIDADTDKKRDIPMPKKFKHFWRKGKLKFIIKY